MHGFDFKLNDSVRIACSGETGTVIGRAHFVNSNDQFLVRYLSGDGRAVEAWWNADALELAGE